MKHLYWYISIMAFLLTGCGPSEETQRKEAAERMKAAQAENEKAFKVAVMPTMDCLPVYLLKDSLLYDTAKVDIRLRIYKAQLDCDTAMIGGSVQASVTDLIRAERLKHRHHVPLTYLTETNAYWELIANKHSQLTKIAELGDKVIAMTRFSVTDYLTNKVIKEAKLKYQAYKVQVNDIEVRLRMLQNDAIDALWLTEPQCTQARLWGNRPLYSSAKDVFIPGAFVFVGAPSMGEQQAFLDAYNKAAEMINAKGVKHFSSLIKKYMKVDDKTIQSLPSMQFKIATAPRPTDIQKAQEVCSK